MKFLRLYGQELGIVLFLFFLQTYTSLAGIFQNRGVFLNILLYILIVVTTIASNYINFGGVKIKINTSEKRLFMSFFSLALVCFLNMLINNYPVAEEYFKYFLIYSVGQLCFFLFVHDYTILIKLVVILSCIESMTIIITKTIGVLTFRDYMSYGFTLLPLLIGMSIGYTYYKNKLILIPEIICFLEIFIYCNRSCIIVFLATIILKKFYFASKSISLYKLLYSIIRIIAAMSICVVFLSNLSNIYGYFYGKGIDVRFLKYLLEFVEYKDSTVLLVGRDKIWANAVSLWLENPVFGKGVGIFESLYGGYTHNLLLDILTQFGIIGLAIFGYIFFKSIRNMFHIKNIEKKLLAIFLLSIWLVKLMVSSTFWMENTFWLYFIVCFDKKLNDYSEVHR